MDICLKDIQKCRRKTVSVYCNNDADFVLNEKSLYCYFQRIEDPNPSNFSQQNPDPLMMIIVRLDPDHFYSRAWMGSEG